MKTVSLLTLSVIVVFISGVNGKWAKGEIETLQVSCEFFPS